MAEMKLQFFMVSTREKSKHNNTTYADDESTKAHENTIKHTETSKEG